MPRTLRVAALGSSFAAGPTIEPVIDRAAGRSGRNYAQQLVALLGADLVDLSVSGATTANVIDTAQHLITGEVVPPQLEGVPRDADVVTITAGGNDLNYLGGMLFAAAMRTDPDGPVAQLLGVPGAGIVVPTDADERAAADGLIQIVAAVRSVAPGARVVLVDYLTILDPSTSTTATTPFSDQELADLLRVQAALERVFVVAAARSGADLVRASDLSARHGLGSAHPWVQDYQPALDQVAGSFHPRDAGMRAIAVELAALLGG